MTHQDWIELFAPTIAGIVLAIGAGLVSWLTGLTKQLSAYFVTHQQAAAAKAAAEAGQVIGTALMTGAATIAGKIQTGELDYSDRASLVAEAQREVGLVEKRTPQMLAIAAPIPGALVANLMGKVDAMVVASPSLPLEPKK